MVELVIVGVFRAVVISHLEHARERAIGVEDLSAAHQGESLREGLKDLEPAVEGLFGSLLAKERLFVQHLYLVCDYQVKEDAKDAPDDKLVHFTFPIIQVISRLVHVVGEERRIDYRAEKPALVEHDEDEERAGDSNNHRIVDGNGRAIVVHNREVVKRKGRHQRAHKPGADGKLADENPKQEENKNAGTVNNVSHRFRIELLEDVENDQASSQQNEHGPKYEQDSAIVFSFRFLKCHAHLSVLEDQENSGEHYCVQ